MDTKDLKAAAVKFLDNGGDGTCSYCKGAKDPSSSDNPDKAIISLKNERETSYAQYITVQNELVGAYNELRNRRALELGPKRGFNDMNFIEMQKNFKDVKWNGNKEKLKEVIEQIKKEYPQKLSEVQEQN
jgi:glutaredoxin